MEKVIVIMQAVFSAIMVGLLVYSLCLSKEEKHVICKRIYKDALYEGIKAYIDAKEYRHKAAGVESIARYIGSNKTYVTAIIHDQYNCSVSEFINRLRIEDAKQMKLAHMDYKMSVITEAVGFCDASAFCKAFKKQEGCTPMEWLAQHS